MSNGLNRRNFLRAVGGGATVAIAGCGGSPQQTDTPSDDDGGTGATEAGTATSEPAEKVLQLNLIQQETLDPVAIKGKASGGANWQMHEQVFAFEDGILPPTGRLASDYSIDDDNVTYHIELKEGVTFHDGSELTAGDVVYSWKRLAGSEHNRGNSSKIIGSTFTVNHETDDEGNYVPGSLAVEAEDEYTVKLELAQPFHSTLSILGDIVYSIVPEGIVGDVEGYEGEMSYEQFSTQELPGTGPFQFSLWNQGQAVEVERYDGYHGTVANLDKIRWNVLGNPNTVYNRAMNKNLDFFDIPRSQFDPEKLSIEEELEGSRKVGSYGPARNDETLNYGEATLLQTDYVLFHTLEVPKPVRQAMAYVLNQQELVDDVFKGLGTPAYHVTPPFAYPGGKSAYDRHAQQNYPYGYNETRIEDARQVMEDAGYSEDNPYSATFTAYSDSNASTWGAIASLFRDKLASAHVDLEVERAPSSTVTNRAIEGSFQMFGTFNELEWVEADSTLRFVRPTQFTWTRWGQGDEVSEAAQTADDAWTRYQENKGPSDAAEEVRNDVYVTLEEMNWEDVTELPLIHRVETRFSYDWVENLDMHGAMYTQLYNEVDIGDRS